MTHSATDDDLQELGIQRSRVGRSETITLTGEPTVLEGLTMSTDTDFEQVVQAGRTTDLESEVAEEMGFGVSKFDEIHTLLAIFTPRDDYRLVGAPERVGQWGGEGVVLYLDTARIDGPAALIDTRNEGLLLELAHESLTIKQVLAPKAQPELDIESGLEDALDSIEDDWLHDAIQARLDHELGWSHLIAIGMYARLSASSASPHDRQVVEAIRRGEPVPRPRPEVAWARLQDEDTLGQVAHFLTSAAVDLEHEIDQFVEAAPESRPPDEEFLSVLERRDELEGIRFLLHAADQRAATDDVFASLDASGEALVERLGGLPDTDNPRLRRASGVSPHGWWVRGALGDIPPMEPYDLES